MVVVEMAVVVVQYRFYSFFIFLISVDSNTHITNPK